MYKIEKGIPAPVTLAKRGRRTKYPFKKLKVGDSFLVPNANKTSLSVCAGNQAKKLNREFITRSIGKKDVRVWRVA